MNQPKKMIFRDMTVSEISSVDIRAQKGATAVILKSGAVDIRKNAADVAAGEIALAKGISAGKALVDYSVSDAVLGDLSRAERMAEAGLRKARTDAVYEASDKWS